MRETTVKITCDNCGKPVDGPHWYIVHEDTDSCSVDCLVELVGKRVRHNANLDQQQPTNHFQLHFAFGSRKEYT